MATLEDIARSVGVSKSTVSKSLSGAPDVSPATRRLVLEKAVELGYTRTTRGAAPRLALFITNMDYENPEDFGYDILVGFRKMAEPAGYQVDILPLTRGLQESIRYDTFMIRENYRGALFLGLSLRDPWQKDFASCKTPTVLYDNRISGNPTVTYVGIDTGEGMLLAVEHLKKLGHRKIGYLSSELEAYIYRQRHQAFFDALHSCGLPEETTLSGCEDNQELCLKEHLPRLVELGCTAILCSHDLLAAAALRRCQALGYRVPEDISIIGFDDLPLCRHTRPTLTTVRQNRTELGKSAFCALSSQMEGVPLSTFLLHAELVPRGSTAAPGK